MIFCGRLRIIVYPPSGFHLAFLPHPSCLDEKRPPTTASRASTRRRARHAVGTWIEVGQRSAETGRAREHVIVSSSVSTDAGR